VAVLSACVALASSPAAGEGIRSVLRPPVLLLANPLGAIARALWGSTSVWAENRRLKTEVARLRVDENVRREVEQENRRLRELLAFQSRSPYGLVPARVIGRSSDRVGGSAVIDRGSRYGIRPGQTVLSLSGLAGRVVSVSGGSAVVRTLLAEDSPVSAYDTRTFAEGIIEWRAGPPPRFHLKDIPAQADVAVGDELTSTGYGGMYPRGIPVGRVRRVGLEATGLVKDIDIAPATRFARLEDLIVLVTPPPGDSLAGLWLETFPAIAASRNVRRAGIDP
jgi:rod shape-determining protein MreC